MKFIKHGRLEVLNKYPFNIDRSKCDVCLPLNSRLFPESRKLPLSSSLMCVTRPARVRNTRSQRSQRPGPALQSPVSEALAWAWVSPLWVEQSVSEVSPALWSSVTIRVQAREDIRTSPSVQQPKIQPNTVLVTIPLLSTPINVSAVQLTRELGIIGIEVKVAVTISR